MFDKPKANLQYWSLTFSMLLLSIIVKMSGFGFFFTFSSLWCFYYFFIEIHVPNFRIIYKIGLTKASYRTRLCPLFRIFQCELTRWLNIYISKLNHFSPYMKKSDFVYRINNHLCFLYVHRKLPYLQYWFKFSEDICSPSGVSDNSKRATYFQA